MPSLKRHDGELQVDNSNTPDVPVPGFGRGGMQMAAPTISCAHCGSVVMLNPFRERPRNYCRKCDRYICDGCGIVTQKPGYEHRSFEQLSDMVTSGKYTIVGGSPCEPIVVPTAPAGLIIPGV